MKKQSLDKTKQQFKLGERVFAVVQKDRADCLIEGHICGVSKQPDNADAEVSYTIRDVCDSLSPCDRFFDVTYDSVFKDLETAQQKGLDAVAQNYEKAKAAVTSTFTAIKAKAVATAAEPD